MYQIIKSIDGSQCVRWDGEDGFVIVIPINSSNTDYQAYLVWLAEGNEPVIVESEGA
jgi:hypothetical protein